MLNKEEIEAIKIAYTERIEQIKRFERLNSGELDSDGDETDVSQCQNMLDITNQIANKEKFNLIKIHNALKKLENNQAIDECEICMEEIPFKRLLIIPGCRICIDCQSDMESGRA